PPILPLAPLLAYPMPELVQNSRWKRPEEGRGGGRTSTGRGRGRGRDSGRRSFHDGGGHNRVDFKVGVRLRGRVEGIVRGNDKKHEPARLTVLLERSVHNRNEVWGTMVESDAELGGLHWPQCKGLCIEVLVKGSREVKGAPEPMLVPYVELPASTKPLLVLDLNGVLLDRQKYGKREGKKTAQLRPHCSEFIDFCFHEFTVALWSCGRRDNMELDLFTKHVQELLFIFDQTDSTSLWPRTSTVSKQKPLFLKDLHKVWELFPAFSEHNTVLLDNHVEKFERNPLGTCMLVPEYDVTLEEAQGDATLAQQGSLVQQLQMIADLARQGGSTSKHIRGLAAEVSFFPQAHPEAPEEGNSHSSQQGGSPPPSKPQDTLSALAPPFKPLQDVRQASASTATPSPPASELLDLLDQSARLLDVTVTSECGPHIPHALANIFCTPTHLRLNPRCTPSFYMEARDIPGPRSAPLHKRDLPGIKSPGAYVACEKSDGERRMLFVVPEQAAQSGEHEVQAGVYLVNRAWGVKYVAPAACQPGSALGRLMEAGAGPSVLDGELVEYEGSGKPFYLAFDCIQLKGRDVGCLPNLRDRMLALKEMLGSAEGWKGQEEATASSFSIICKQFYPVNEVQKVLSCITIRPDGKRVFSDGSRHNLNDGVVFTPATVTYYSYMVCKWKPSSMLTVDFEVRGNDLRNGLRQRHRSDSVTLSVRLKGSPIPVGNLKLSLLSSSQCEDLREALKTGKKGLIVECHFAKESGEWMLVKARPDKGRANSVSTAWGVLESVAEGLEEDVLVEALECTSASRKHST
ncbi:unnamed protein product, partial [Chrysoparadoxa australica]